MKSKTTTTPLVAVHLDFKGVLFKTSYFTQLMQDLSAQGVNAVLVEYEDVFPFKGMDITYSRADRWSEQTFRQFLAAAREHGIEIIPLQQCLGHLEYLFRWNRYRPLAENREYPSTLCLSNPEGKALIADLLAQVMAAHPDSRFVHLGMDEAHKLATCPKCLKKGDILTVFLDYLDELCAICEAHGKTPIIWSDMLEDHFRPGVFARFRDRVILAPWDYGPHGEVDMAGRIAGFRASRQWLDHADDPAAPALNAGSTFIEDLPPAITKAMRPYRKGKGFIPIYQGKMWADMGFRVLGASVIRSSPHLSVMPDFNEIQSNIRAWAKIILATKQFGIVGTSWARGTSFCPPGFTIDLTWPNITSLARAMGRRPQPFWTGVPSATLTRIIAQLGRCMKDWRLEEKLIQELNALRPHIQTHRFEWDSLILMTRVLALHRRAEYAVSEVEYFNANTRPVDSEWQRRLDDQAGILKDMAVLRREVLKHFGKRYTGDAFHEWVRDLFDLKETKLKTCRKISLTKKTVAARRYAGR